MYIQVCAQVMYSIVGSHLCICLIFISSPKGALSHFRHYNLVHMLLQKSLQKLQVGTNNRAQLKTIMYIQVCTQVMYSIVGSHLCISLIFSSFSRRAIGRFQHYNSRTHSITKKPTENFRQVHKIEQTHKQLCTFRYVHR